MAVNGWTEGPFFWPRPSLVFKWDGSVTVPRRVASRKITPTTSPRTKRPTVKNHPIRLVRIGTSGLYDFSNVRTHDLVGYSSITKRLWLLSLPMQMIGLRCYHSTVTRPRAPRVTGAFWLPLEGSC